jgi:hypothetical protein
MYTTIAGSQILPVITRHFIKHRAFAMHYFIMTERQHKIFIIIIHHAECKLILVMLPKQRIKFEIIKRIMHPSHHPFHTKA